MLSKSDFRHLRSVLTGKNNPVFTKMTHYPLSDAVEAECPRPLGRVAEMRFHLLVDYGYFEAVEKTVDGGTRNYTKMFRGNAEVDEYIKDRISETVPGEDDLEAVLKVCDEMGAWPCHVYIEYPVAAEYMPVKERLIDAITRYAPDRELRVDRPFCYEGVVYDYLRRLPEKGNKPFLLDRINGDDCPLWRGLEELTPSHLLLVCQAIKKDFLMPLLNGDEKPKNGRLGDAAMLRCFAGIEARDRKSTACEYIYEHLCIQAQVSGWKPGDEEREFLRFNDSQLPYLVTLDGFAGETISEVREFSALRITMVEEGRFHTKPYSRDGEPLFPEEDIVFAEDGAWVVDQRTMSSTEFVYLPDDSLFLIEDALNRTRGRD